MFYTVILATIPSTSTFSLHLGIYFMKLPCCTVTNHVHSTLSPFTVTTDAHIMASSRFTVLIKGLYFIRKLYCHVNSNYWRIFHGRFTFYRDQLHIFQSTFTLCIIHWCNFTTRSSWSNFTESSLLAVTTDIISQHFYLMNFTAHSCFTVLSKVYLASR